MKRYERILRIPCVTITKEMASKVATELNSIAESKLNVAIEERLRNLYRSNPQAAAGLDPQARDENELVTRNVNSPALRNLIRVEFAETFTFLSPRENIRFVGEEFELSDIPRDTFGVLARANGVNERFVDISLKANFENYNAIIDPNVNRVIVQGEDKVWVDAVATKIRDAFGPETEMVRTALYKLSVLWTWITFGLIVALEYRIATRFVRSFDYKHELTGLSSLLIFILLAVTVIASTQLVIRASRYLYPYFEIEGNLSRNRVAFRKPITAAVAVLYSAAVAALFVLK